MLSRRKRNFFGGKHEEKVPEGKLRFWTKKMQTYIISILFLFQKKGEIKDVFALDKQ